MPKPTSAGRILSLPVEPRTKRRARAVRSLPSSDYLTNYRNNRGVHWIAVDLATVSEILDAARAAGVEFSDRLALVDLHHAAERGQLRPFRYYAARWRWTPYRTRKLFEAEGLLSARPTRSKRGAHGAHKRRTVNDDSAQKTASGRTRGAQEAHSNTQTETDTKKGAGAPSVSDSEKGKKKAAPQSPKPKDSNPARRKPTKDERAREAQRIAAAIDYPVQYDTPEIRLEFARWVYYRMYVLPKKKPVAVIVVEDADGYVPWFQTQINHAANAPESGEYYIPGGAAGYLAALEFSRGEGWRHPYPSKTFKPGGANGGRDKDLLLI